MAIACDGVTYRYSDENDRNRWPTVKVLKVGELPQDEDRALLDAQIGKLRDEYGDMLFVFFLPGDEKSLGGASQLGAASSTSTPTAARSPVPFLRIRTSM